MAVQAFNSSLDVAVYIQYSNITTNMLISCVQKSSTFSGSDPPIRIILYYNVSSIIIMYIITLFKQFTLMCLN